MGEGRERKEYRVMLEIGKTVEKRKDERDELDGREGKRDKLYLQI